MVIEESIQKEGEAVAMETELKGSETMETENEIMQNDDCKEPAENEAVKNEESQEGAETEQGKSYTERQREKFEKNKEMKKSLIEEARALISSNNWKQASEKQKELFEKWKKSGYAAEENDSLWEEFKAVRDEFYSGMKKHFEELDASHREAADKKRSLIAQAKAMSFSGENYEEDSKRMDELFEQWKKAGFAGKELNDSLWEEFNAAREPFFAIRDEHRKQVDAQFAEKREKKQALIEEAKKLFEAGDTGKEATIRIKELSNEWKEIGFSGKKGSQELWDEFKKAQDEFWALKKERDAKRNAEGVEKLKEAVSRRQQRIKKIKENIDHLTKSILGPGKGDQVFEWIAKDQEQIEELKAEIESINEKIAAIEAR